jgi:hypothetical protein
MQQHVTSTHVTYTYLYIIHVRTGQEVKYGSLLDAALLMLGLGRNLMLLKGKPPLPRAPTPELQPQAPLTIRDPQVGLHLGWKERSNMEFIEDRIPNDTY